MPLPTPIARLLAAGLVGAALAAPMSASAGLSILKDLKAGAPVTAELQPTTVRVSSPRQLLSVLLDEQYIGRVILPRDVQWDLSGYGRLPLRAGVELIGERGALGSRPLLFTTALTLDGGGYAFFEVVGNDVRVEGLHFRGPANGSRGSSLPGVSAIKVSQMLQDLQHTQGFRVVIADNEFEEWTHSGVQVGSDVPSVGRERAGLVRVERNFFHDNSRDNLGYGVSVFDGSYATIEGNVFNYNRHAVAASGDAGGYLARFNYVLQGGYRQDGTVGSYYNQHFDAHGSNGGYGGRAGEYFDVSFNTVRGEQKYYVVKTRPALMLRGTPDVGFHFNGNVLVHDDGGEALAFDGVSLLDLARAEKLEAVGNQFDTDHSQELATGDFDGDGHTDVFLANGTGWFYSRGGQRAWEFLHASNKRVQELGFADIDNDGVTDVLYRDPNGNLGSLKSGTVALVNFTTLPVPVKELRAGDFDGDSKTDLFYTRGGQWRIWYGKTRLWTSAQSSSLAVSEFLFGEFDAVRGTDVAAVTSGMWAISSGGMGTWKKLNDKLTRSFAHAVAADFDGNGRSDIAWNEGGLWRFSRDGVAPLALLRDGGKDGLYHNLPLNSLLVGAFDGGTRAQVVRFNEAPWDLLSGDPDERLGIWRGLGTASAFSAHSEHNMR